MAKCPHERFKHDFKMTYCNVSGMGGGKQELRQLYLTVRLVCTACSKPFVFRGDPGVSTFCPAISPDGTQLRAPLDWPDDSGEEADIEEEKTVH